MLKNLFIQNYAIIEELNMEFGNKLNIITGETGAGKSILTGALGLIQGNRADTKVLYDQEKKCIVEAEFIDHNPKIKTLFLSEEMDFESTIIVRRIIAPSGKSRAFVNDEPVNLTFLKKLSALMVDMHRQFDTLGINKEATQIEMLDSVAKNEAKLKSYKASYATYKKDKNNLESLIDEESKVLQELDFLEFQLKELDEAGFIAGEQEALESEVNLLQNADSIISVMQKIAYQVDEADQSIVIQLAELQNELERLGEVGQESASVAERLQGIIEELRDITATSNAVSEKIDSDPSLLEEKSERQSLLYRILQKHNKENLDDLLSFQDELSTKVFQLKSYGKDRSSLEEKVAEAEKLLHESAKLISQERGKAIPIFEKNIKGLLADLGMAHAQFVIELQLQETLRTSGADEVEFVFSANPGKAPQALNEVASGGELSRLALSLKSIVAGNMELGTLIFDEIDTGISGDVSGKMGTILQKLAKQHQLICITHSPQIASKADTHFFIYKEVENNRTYTKVKTLNQDERVTEIATMLSGNPPSSVALENAKDLISI